MKTPILVVDDDTRDQKVMETYLKKAGFKEIFFAKNAKEGVRRARELAPGFLILDTKLPDMDGFEVCRLLKQDKSFKTKIILLTGFINAIDALKAREAGSDEYCVKTKDCRPLLEAVKKVTVKTNVL